MAGLGDIAGNLTSGFSSATMIGQYIFYGLILGLVIWFAIYITSFNVEVRIMERNRGSTPIERKEAGRFKKDKNNPGVMLFTMMRDKRWEMPFPTDYIQLKRGGFGKIKKVVYFIEDEEGRLQPVKPPMMSATEKWVGWKPNAMEFVTRKVKEYIDRFKKGDFMSKYGALVQIGAFLIMFVMILVLFRKLEGVVEGLNNVAGALQAAASNYNAAAGVPPSQVIG